MMRVPSVCRLMTIAGILVGAWCWGILAPAGEMRVNQWSRSQPGAQQFVAIMGEVARPGVFELANPLPELSELVRLAGGTSASASGSVRIMRAGRMMQLFLSPKLHYGLVPNDLIVVEAKQFSTVRNFADSGPAIGQGLPPPTTLRAAEPTVVQLGLVNLIGRPVILDVTPEQSQLQQVLSQLRQASSGPGSVTVIKPGAGMQEVPLDSSSQIQLSSGSVLMFNPASVNVGALPRLPNTVKPNGDPASAAATEPAESSPIASPEPLLRAPVDLLRDRPTLLPRTDNPSNSNGVVAAASGETAQKPNVGPAEQVQELPTAGDDASVVPSETADDDQLPETAGEPPAETAQADNESGRSFSFATWAVLAGLLGCCLAPWLWFRRKKPVPPPVVAIQSSEPSELESTADSLEALIAGSLDIAEEPLELPFESAIFGRPMKRPTLLFDRAHELEGPHYKLREPIEPEPVAQIPELSPEQPDATPRERKMRVDRAHPRSDRGVLDRVLATFEGDHS